MKDRGIIKTYFRTCSALRPCSQAGLNLCAFPTISIRSKPTFVSLRYNLAGYRPSKTAHLTLFPSESSSELSKLCHISKRGITLFPLLGPSYYLAIKMHEAMSNYSKAPRGLFVQVELGRVFTAIAISPSERSRQLSVRDAIRAGRNSPDEGLRYRRTVIVTAAVYWSLNSMQDTLADNHISS